MSFAQTLSTISLSIKTKLLTLKKRKTLFSRSFCVCVSLGLCLSPLVVQSHFLTLVSLMYRSTFCMFSKVFCMFWDEFRARIESVFRVVSVNGIKSKTTTKTIRRDEWKKNRTGKDRNEFLVVANWVPCQLHLRKVIELKQ